MRILLTALVAAFMLSTPTQAKQIELTWYCQDWEAHNRHFSPAAHGKWIEQLAAIRFNQVINACIYDKGSRGELMHVIGEVSFIQPGAPETERRWWQALMIRHENGKVVYTVKQRP